MQKINPVTPVVEFGFKFNDFNVVQDTIENGDTFGSIIDAQNLGKNEVFDIAAKVKDTFDVRMMRKGKPFTILRTKDRTKKIQAFIYQPDRLNYYIIDLELDCSS